MKQALSDFLYKKLEFFNSKFLYRALTHDFRYQPFIDACENKMNTICVTENEHGKIYGYYTDIPW